MSLPKMLRVFPALLCLACVAGSTSVLAQKTTAPRRGQFAFVHAMTPAAGGGFTITVDYAELLTGDAAERAAREDGQPSPKDLNGLYIENRTKSLRTLAVPAWAQVYLLQEMQPTLVKPAVLQGLLNGVPSSFGSFYGFPYNCDGDERGHCLPVRIIQRGGQVLRIDQEYLP